MLPPPCPKRAAAPATPCRSSSEHHRVAPHGERRWASLPTDLVELIGRRLLAGDDLRDYIRFRAVCSHWSSSTVDPRGRGILDPRFHPRRWMMLPEGHGLYPGHPSLGRYVRFFSLSTGAFIRVHLPLLDDHTVLESVDGLLLLYRRHDTAVRLLHPFTSDIAELPPLLSLLPQMDMLGDHYHYKPNMDLRSKLGVFPSDVCAVVAVSASGAISVMLALKIDRVAHATTGDQRWTLSSWALPRSVAKPVAFQGKLYMASTDWENADHELPQLYIYQIDLPQPDDDGSYTVSLPPPEMIALWPGDFYARASYMVECGSDLMLVLCITGDAPHARLVVHRLADLISGRVVPLTSIGEHALILGETERGMCLSPSKGLPTISGNSIICETSAEIIPGCPLVEGYCWAYHRRFEQCHLACGTWSLVIDNSELHSIPAGPCSLIHHIVTCCNRRYWKKEFRMENIFSYYSCS